VVQNSVNALSGVWSTMEIVSRHSRLRLNERGVLFAINVSIPGAWGIIEPANLSDTASICGGLGGVLSVLISLGVCGLLMSQLMLASLLQETGAGVL